MARLIFHLTLVWINIVPSNHSKKVFEQAEYTAKDQMGNIVNTLKSTKPLEVLFEGADENISE